MKKILLSAVLAGFLILPIASLTVEPVEAAACSDFNSSTACNTNARYGCIWDPVKNTCTGVYFTGAGDLISLIGTIGNWAFAAVLAISALFLIYAGFLWVTAGGNPEGANKARQMLTNALIGVVVALLARGLVQVIRSIIGG